MSLSLVSFEQDYADRFHGVEIQHGTDPNDTSIPYDNNTQARCTAEHVGSLRLRLFSEIANDTQDIDVEAIDSYFHGIGLLRREFLVLKPDDLPIYNRITAQYGWPAYPSDTEDGSFYYGVCPVGTDLAVVLRDKEAETIHGAAFTEGHLVHELAHASSDWNEWTINKYPGGRSLSARRLGQTIISMGANSMPPRSGDYLEEAFAATIQANYLKNQGKEHSYKNYADIAADGLACLYSNCPDLLPAMIEARRSVGGLRRVARYINEIHPGLYSQLQKIGYTKEEFTQATQYIHEIVS